METWIKLYRKFLDWEWFDKPEMVQFFVWLLLSATSTDRQWRGQTVKRGQLLTTFAEITSGTGLSRQQARTCIAKLQATREITYKSTNRYSLITICKYDDYQGDCDSEQPANQPTNQPASNPPITSISTVNKNVRNNNSSSTAPARTREEGFIERMKSSQIWLEVMAKNYGIDIPRLLTLLDEFFINLKCRNKQHRDYNDACAHFNDWLMKRQQYERDEQRAAVGSKNVNELWQ